MSGQRSPTSQSPSDSQPRVLRPQPPGPRRIGPGRVELGYRRRLRELELEAARDREQKGELEGRLARAQGELEVAGRLERGLQRLADRLEERVATADQREKRLILALGALQKENEMLRERLALSAAPRAPELPPAAPAARRRAPGARRGADSSGWLARLLSRG